MKYTSKRDLIIKKNNEKITQILKNSLGYVYTPYNQKYNSKSKRIKKTKDDELIKKLKKDVKYFKKIFDKNGINEKMFFNFDILKVKNNYYKKWKKDNKKYIDEYLKSDLVEKCTICHECIHDDIFISWLFDSDYSVSLPCGHRFHSKCIAKWFENDDLCQCPNCRNNLFLPLISKYMGKINRMRNKLSI